MFKLLQVILAATLAIVAVNGLGGSVQYKGNMKHPELSDHCYFVDYKISIPINETVYPKDLKDACIKVSCQDDYLLEIKHCKEPYYNKDGCKRSPNDYTKKFPDCCPVSTCDGVVHHEEDY